MIKSLLTHVVINPSQVTP
ncbi:unnamed protein product [Priceomyces carsonii]|nr:unnamed protein product [Priceomyces carsonii]